MVWMQVLSHKKLWIYCMMENKTIIHGVHIKLLKHSNVKQGEQLFEVQRNDEEIYPGFGQVHVTITHTGITKAWYFHEFQVDQMVVLRGVMKLVIYDSRINSPSHQVINEFI